MTEVWPIIASVVTALPIGAWLSSWILKSKYRSEVDQLKAQVEQLRSNTKATEIDNLKRAMEIIMAQFVEPLNKELNALRKELSRFRRAVEKIPTCPHAANCPISDELQRQEATHNN